MTTGWTGGQYSIYRALLAVEMAKLLCSRIPTTAPIGVACLTLGLLACAALALGWRDRIAAGLLAAMIGGVVALIDGAPLVMPGPDVILGGLLLMLHLGVPRHPFGAWDARGRTDPAGDWRMPSWIPHFTWALLATIHLVIGLERISGVAFRPAEIDAGLLAEIGLVFDSAFVIATFRTRWRAAAWIAMSLWNIAWFAAFGPAVVESNLWLLQLLAVDPRWLPGRSQRAAPQRGSARARVFYDGDCGLCHRSIRFILAEEVASPEALRLRFSPIEGKAFASMLANRADVGDLPDSIVLELEDASILTRSRATIEIANRLGGFWRVLAFLGRLVPPAILDLGYDAIASIRSRLFARPKESCPQLPPALRARFDL
jgi:predicted DCC family thiol-disulfide oxidoreductase YuxK